ncbi:SLBB domain-containing protein [Synechocystis salina LEGE 00031]|uniref:SLBB domain-containing protein n=1 Tax=Synechocystis salina LEGE 00031 TaxID=1828736 RepID=A0ABR9VPH4_9SYNC|nr:SLBB domain-containing protein [Synechocystis salina LEGE 00041]MBE9252798.1 SLBB domain-containing protein [Synechocystis salina LEGE 00031]
MNVLNPSQSLPSKLGGAALLIAAAWAGLGTPEALAQIGSPAPGQLQQFTSQNTPSVLPPESEYTLGPGDRLRVDVFQVQELSGEYQVLVDGTIGFPLIGTVRVADLTIPELNQLLANQYARYIRRPLVTAILTSPRPLNITLSGEVNSPGAYALAIEGGQKFPTLTQVIQQAGGLTPVSDISRVQLRRQKGNYQENYSINLWELLREGNSRQNVTLRDGDIVVIPSKTATDPREVRQLADANFGIRFEQEINVAVIGEIFRPGSYKLSPAIRASSITEVSGDNTNTNRNTTGSRANVENTQPVRLTQAIQEAGGIKSQADIRNVEVRRENRDGNFELIVVNLWELLDEGNLDKDVILQNGDVITVPQAKELSPNEFEAIATANFSPRSITVNVVGEVRRGGAIQLQPNSTLNQAILAAGSFDPVRADKASVDLIRLNPDGTVTRLNIAPDFSLNISSDRNPTLRNNDVVLVNTSGLTQATDTLRELFSPIGALLGGGIPSLINILN